MNPLTCGVAKFNAELAKRLGVEWIGLVQPHRWGDFPLFSLKWSEMTIGEFADATRPGLKYGVFWHDGGHRKITDAATIVFYADPSLGSPGLWCPSLITPRKRPVRLFSFGMAHKLQTDKYQRVCELLDEAGQPYHLRVSVGLHEGTSLDGVEKHFDALKAIMGEANVTILGILSDDAVSEELANAEYVLAFFENGLRANNTTVHAALDAGKTVITNCDDSTPEALQNEVWNIAYLEFWEDRSPRLYSWNNLIAEMKGVCERSRSTAAR